MGIDNLVKKLQAQPKTVEEHFAEKKQEWVEDVRLAPCFCWSIVENA